MGGEADVALGAGSLGGLQAGTVWVCRGVAGLGAVQVLGSGPQSELGGAAGWSWRGYTEGGRQARSPAPASGSARDPQTTHQGEKGP